MGASGFSFDRGSDCSSSSEDSPHVAVLVVALDHSRGLRDLAKILRDFKHQVSWVYGARLAVHRAVVEVWRIGLVVDQHVLMSELLQAVVGHAEVWIGMESPQFLWRMPTL